MSRALTVATRIENGFQQELQLGTVVETVSLMILSKWVSNAGHMMLLSLINRWRHKTAAAGFCVMAGVEFRAWIYSILYSILVLAFIDQFAGEYLKVCAS